jgi:hypothetical protein
MQNDTDLIFEAYKEIYSEGWKDATAALLMMLGMGTGVGHLASDIHQKSLGYPKLTPPQIEMGVNKADPKAIKSYLDKMNSISERNEIPSQHIEALTAIANNKQDTESAKKAEDILNTMLKRSADKKQRMMASFKRS